MPKMTRSSVMVDTVVIMARLLTFPPMEAPTSRPMSIINQ